MKNQVLPKKLKRNKLVIRKEYPQIPPKVEYSLSDRGKSLMPILDCLCEGAIITEYKIKQRYLIIAVFVL